MLKLLRKKGLAKRIIWVIAIVIIFSFGFFGTAYLITGGGGTDYAGVVFGKKITVEDFNKFYRNTRIKAIRQYGTNLDKIAHMLNLEAQTWDRIILLYEAKKKKIRIPDDEIVRTIENDPSFKKDDRFDILLYNAILRSLQIRPRDYEESVRDELKIAELYQEATSSVNISPQAVLDEYEKRNEKVQVSYVYVAFDKFKEEAVVAPDEIEQYFQDHSDEFEAPPAVNVQYLSFDFLEPPETESPEDEVDDALEAQKDLIREKADVVFQGLLVDPDMTKAADKHNLQIKATGFFSMEQPNLTLGWSYDLLNAIFSMNLNDVSEPFETATGLTIVQVKDKRDAYIPEFAEAKDKVRETLLEVKSKEIAEAKAREQLEAIRTALDASKLKDFAKTAKDLELEIHQTPVFNRGQYLPQVGISNEFEEAAFRLTEDNPLSGVVETAKGYCILYLDSYTPVDMKEYEEAKGDLAQEIMDQKRNAAFGEFLSQLRIDSGLVDRLPELKAQAGR